MNWIIEAGDQVKFPGFPGVLTVEAVAGALATVAWRSSDGRTSRAEVFLSRLEPAELSQPDGGKPPKSRHPYPPMARRPYLQTIDA